MSSDTDSADNRRSRRKKGKKSRRHSSSNDSSPVALRRSRSRSPLHSSKFRSEKRSSAGSKPSGSQRKSSKHSIKRSGDKSRKQSHSKPRHSGSRHAGSRSSKRSDSSDSSDDDRSRIAAQAKKMSTEALKAEIAATKDKMRKSLLEAGKVKSNESIASTLVVKNEQQPIKPEEIMRIDAAGFEPQSFESSRSDRKSDKSKAASSFSTQVGGTIATPADAHAAAIFGTETVLDSRALLETVSVELEAREDDAPIIEDLGSCELDAKDRSVTARSNRDVGIFCAELFESQEVRWKRWAEILQEMRKTLAEGNRISAI